MERLCFFIFIREHPVLLNRAPTLHRLGIQAFEPVLVEGKAIQIHPLVCKAFNADFDGDQMAVHVPLSAEAQAEARVLMLSVNNILSPANGRPIAVPTHEMVLGVYFLTYKQPAAATNGNGKARSNGDGESALPTFGSIAEAVMAYDFQSVSLQDPIVVRLPEGKLAHPEADPKIETTVGRLLFNEALPDDFPFINDTLQSKEISSLVARIADRYDQTKTAEVLNNLKNLGFHWASRAGVTVSIQDVLKPPHKQEILDEFEKRAEKVESQFRKGIITDDERRQELIEIWTEATERVREDMEERFRQEPFNPIYMMATSGARGNMTQVRQIAGMRGLVANPKGDIIPRPIKANFREGLSVLEYFISTHGARKGLADTALRTADSGYLTRRLVDVTQDVIVREADCGTERGIPVTVAMRQPVPGKKGEFEWTRGRAVESQALSRVLAQDVVDPDKGKQVLFEAGTQIDEQVIDALVEYGVEEVLCRSVLTCDSRVGVCQQCYGRSLASNRLVDIGEAVGIIAAQSIGEPGTQLTMRTFHTGGIAGEDITHGLPRVQELFEARTPKGMTPIAEFSGRLAIEEVDKGVQVTITSDEGEEWQTIVPRRARLRVEDGQQVEVGEAIVDGVPNPKEMLRVLGIRATQRHLVEEVQKVYTSQGVTIHDKHIELIVRQNYKK
jgi:DNA-directed RNA polymerase subunit beta'